MHCLCIECTDMECLTLQPSPLCTILYFHIVNINIYILTDGVIDDLSAQNIIESKLGFGVAQFNIWIIHTDADDVLLHIMILEGKRHESSQLPGNELPGLKRMI